LHDELPGLPAEAAGLAFTDATGQLGTAGAD